MRRRGSMPFVIEVKGSRRRLGPGIPTGGLADRKIGFRVHANGPDALFASPRNESEQAGNRTIEAARLAADRVFTKPGPSASLLERRNQQTDAVAAAGDQVRPSGISGREAVQETPTPEVQASAPDGKPRTGRILESLTSKDPMEALFRQKEEEEEAPPRRARGPGSRRAVSGSHEAPDERSRERFPAQSVADSTATPAAVRIVSTDTRPSAETETGAPNALDEAETLPEKHRHGTPRPAKRRRPTSRKRPVTARRAAKARSSAKRKYAIGVAGKGPGKAAISKRRTSKSVAGNKLRKGTVRKNTPGKSAVGKKAVSKSAKHAARKTAPRKGVTKKAKTNSRTHAGASKSVKSKPSVQKASTKKVARRRPARR